MRLDELLGDSIIDDIDNVDLVDIDFEGIELASKDAALSLVDNLSKFYEDGEFLRRNPNLKKRVDSEIESLRILIKMRKTDEVAHDLIMKAIAGNSSNASLYKSLSDIQKTILAVTTKIEDTVNSLNNMLKGYQLELNFNNHESIAGNVDDNINSINTHRGSKDFIRQMQNMQ